MHRIAGAKEALGAAEQTRVMLVPADSAAGAKRLGDFGFVADCGGGDLIDTGKEGGSAFVGEYQRLFRRHRESRGARIVVNVPGRRLCGSPFADISLSSSGTRGQLGRG